MTVWKQVWFYGTMTLTVYSAAMASQGSAGWFRVFAFMTVLDLAMAMFACLMVALVALAVAVCLEEQLEKARKKVGRVNTSGFRRLVCVAYDVGLTVFMAYLGWYWMWTAWLAITFLCAAVSFAFYEVIVPRVFAAPDEPKT